MEKKRIAYLDVLKCLAIMMVIDGHVRTYNGFETYESLSSQLVWAPRIPLFFFISGFLAYKVNMTFKDVFDNIRRKFVYLVIPALVFCLGKDLMNHKYLFRFLSEGMHVYWFTIVLFECFLIYYVVMLAVKNEKWRISVLLAVSLTGVVILSLNKDFGPALFDIRRLTKYFQFFVIGTVAMKFRPRFESLMNNEIVKSVLLFSFFIVLFLMTYDMPSSIHHFLRDVVLRYLGTFALVSFFVCHENSFQRQTRFNSMINSIGQNSLAIYLLQFFFLPHFQPRPEWFSGLDMVTVHLMSMLYTVVITALCMVFIKFLSYSTYIRKYVLGKK